jgi:hypothetical protein
MRFILLAIVLLLAPAGCRQASPVEAVLATAVDGAGQPLNRGTVFTPDTPRILLSTRVAGLPAGHSLRAEWLYLETGSWKIIRSESFSVGSSSNIVFGFNAPTDGWRPGLYAVKLYLQDRRVNELDFAIRPAADVALPRINRFEVTPGEITAGDQATLSWNISGATRVVIEPDIGSVGAGGTTRVSPADFTAYRITALNSAGASMSVVSVKVTPAPAGQADLTLQDIFREVVMVYYTVQNLGTAVSKPCNAQLFVGPNMLGTSYIPPLAPGEKRTGVFGQYTWSYPNDTTATVCVDTDGRNLESNEDNNCLTKMLAGVRVQ